MAEITTRVKSWGNSFGIVIPIEVLRSKGIKEGEEVGAVIIKKGITKTITTPIPHNPPFNQVFILHLFSQAE